MSQFFSFFGLIPLLSITIGIVTTKSSEIICSERSRQVFVYSVPNQALNNLQHNIIAKENTCVLKIFPQQSLCTTLTLMRELYMVAALYLCFISARAHLIQVVFQTTSIKNWTSHSKTIARSTMRQKRPLQWPSLAFSGIRLHTLASAGNTLVILAKRGVHTSRPRA